jgi:hypothetical protein
MSSPAKLGLYSLLYEEYPQSLGSSGTSERRDRLGISLVSGLSLRDRLVKATVATAAALLIFVVFHTLLTRQQGS